LVADESLYRAQATWTEGMKRTKGKRGEQARSQAGINNLERKKEEAGKKSKMQKGILKPNCSGKKLRKIGIPKDKKEGG